MIREQLFWKLGGFVLYHRVSRWDRTLICYSKKILQFEVIFENYLQTLNYVYHAVRVVRKQCVRLFRRNVTVCPRSLYKIGQNLLAIQQNEYYVIPGLKVNTKNGARTFLAYFTCSFCILRLPAQKKRKKSSKQSGVSNCGVQCALCMSQNTIEYFCNLIL